MNQQKGNKIQILKKKMMKHKPFMKDQIEDV